MLHDILAGNTALWTLSQPGLWAMTKPTLLDHLCGFMMWDGFAILAFGGILALGLRVYNLKPFLIGAWCIPLADLIMWRVADQSFLHAISYVMIAFITILVLIPIFVRWTSA